MVVAKWRSRDAVESARVVVVAVLVVFFWVAPMASSCIAAAVAWSTNASVHRPTIKAFRSYLLVGDRAAAPHGQPLVSRDRATVPERAQAETQTVTKCSKGL